ncbi:MAG: M20/M25/M40 family metallo-hydrolase [Clostridiales Family XIII bacterium]|jgi:endoglucanase|nr:M20/M25/M40 family metallo-hydrolase [Clostridiales Family XIII bacterium]
MTDIFELQARLAGTACVSGIEQRTAALIRELAAPLADEVWIDTPGNVIAHVRGTGRKILICAHMDVVGFIVRGVDEKGFVWLSRIGGVSLQSCWNRLLRFENGALGTLRFVSGENGAFAKKKVGEITEDDYYCDLGAANREEALAAVSVGEGAVWVSDRRETAEGVLIGPYADDQVGCAILLRLLEELKESGNSGGNDVYVVFTVREEIGVIGALVAGNRLLPDFGIAVDVTTAWDAPINRPKYEGYTRLGAGPVLTVRDALLIADRQFNDRLIAVAEENGIPYQQGFSKGGTDASSFQGVGRGVAVTNVSVPQRYIHTAEEMIARSDAEHVLRLLAAFLSKPAGGADREKPDGSDREKPDGADGGKEEGDIHV